MDRVREGYSHLRARLQDARDSIENGDGSTAELRTVLVDANTISRNLKKPIHARDDARLVSESTELFRKRTVKMTVSAQGQLNSANFVDQLQKQIDVHNQGQRGEGQIKPHEFILKVYKRHQLRAPSIGFMVGPLAIEKKVITRKSREKKTSDEITKETRPNEIKELTGEQERYKHLQYIARVLAKCEENNGGPVPLYEFVLNPWSFSESIENLFNVSFLTRDGRIELDFDPDGTPVLRTVKDKKQQQTAAAPGTAPTDGGASQKKKTATKNQLVIDLNMQQWRKLCNILELEEPVIRSRGNHDSTRPAGSQQQQNE